MKGKVTTETKERLPYIDLTKFIAIITVCIGHVYAMSSLRNGSSVVNSCIASFHMPLFMLLCGFFSGSSMHLDIIVFVKKKAISLLLPALSFSLLSSIVLVCLGKPDLLSRLFSEITGGMWFLRTVFFCYVIVYAAKRTRLPDYACCILSCGFVMFIPHGWYLQTNFLLLFFWTGYFLKKHWEYYRYHGVMAVVAAVYYVLFGRIAPIKVISPDVLINDVTLLPTQYMTALAASLVVIGLSYIIAKWMHLNNNSLLPTMGRYTLGIYGVQTIILERIAHGLYRIVVPDEWTSFYDYFLIPAIGVLFCLLSYYIVRLTEKYSVLNLFLYGNMYKQKMQT